MKTSWKIQRWLAYHVFFHVEVAMAVLHLPGLIWLEERLASRRLSWLGWKAYDLTKGNTPKSPL